MKNYLPAAVGAAAVSVAMLALASRDYGRALRARRQAIFLSRLGDQNEQVDSIILGFKAARLSAYSPLQHMLRDAPFVPALSELLERSGLPTTVASFLLRMLLLPVAIGVVGHLFGLGQGLLLVLGICGALLPLLLVVQARAKRARTFELQLPQALELIGLFLRSGRSLPQAFAGATEELTAPAAEEFVTVAEEYRLGRPLDIALKRLAVKYPDSVGFRLFSIAVGVLGQTGGNLVEVLDRIKKTLDAGMKYSLKLKSMTAESRMSGYILSALPGLFMSVITLIKPDYAHTFVESPLGIGMMVFFLFLWLGGVFWINRLMSSGAAK